MLSRRSYLIALVALCFISQNTYAQLYRLESPKSMFVLRASSGIAAPVIDEPPENDSVSVQHRIGYSGVLGLDWFLTPVMGFYVEGVYSRNGVDVEIMGARPPGIDDITYSSRAVHVGFTLQTGVTPLLFASVGGGIGSLRASLDVGGPEGNITTSDTETGFSVAAGGGARFMLTDRAFMYGEMRWQRIWAGDEDVPKYRLFPVQAGLGVVF